MSTSSVISCCLIAASSFKYPELPVGKNVGLGNPIPSNSSSCPDNITGPINESGSNIVRSFPAYAPKLTFATFSN